MTNKNVSKTEYFEYELHSNMSGKKLIGNAIEQAKTGVCDYTAYDPVSGIGLTEAKGDWRSAQEDRSDFKVTPELMQLNDQQIIEILMKSFASVQQKFGSHRYSGSTLVVAIVIKNKIYIANVGDSNAILMLADVDNNVICDRINTLHNPTTPTEYEYIVKNDGLILHERLGGMLAVSRAIGDNDFEKFGLRHTPDIFIIDLISGKDQNGKLVFKQNQKILGVLLACDGLNEADPDLINMTKRIEAYLLENYKSKTDKIQINSQQLSQMLVHGAYKDRSQDNLTAMIIPVDVASNLPIIAMVADGHGGDEVSEALRKEFISKIIELIKQQKDK